MCCLQCYNQIADVSHKTADLWLEMCRQRVAVGGNFLLRENRVPWMISHLRYLESKGYILTADGHEVQMHVNGCDMIEFESEAFETFCIDRRCHENKWL